MTDLDCLVADLRANATPDYRTSMVERYGIRTQAEHFGVPMGALKTLAKPLRRHHDLALALWETGIHDARMLATMVADPARTDASMMNRWAEGFDNWALVDTACFNLFDRSSDAHGRIRAWSEEEAEFIRRAAFALLAGRALHKRATREELLEGLGIIDRYASDGRNFVKKGANWALRTIGRLKDPILRAAASELADTLAASNDKVRRWNGRDAQRYFAKLEPLA